MNDDVAPIASPSLPASLLFAGAGLTALIILFVLSRIRTRAGAFVVGGAWLRYTMQAFHEITYRPLLAGMSANAVASIGLFLTGLMTINWRHLAMRIMLPFYALVAVALLSAIANREFTGGLITVVTKYGYLIVVTLSVFAALQRSKTGSFMVSLLWAFAPVLLFQALSVVLGIGKATEAQAGSESYIGGYNHEAVFSVILATCMTVACFTERLNRYTKAAVIFACIAGIILANYRTTLVAITPLLAMYFGSTWLQRFAVRDRPFVVSALIVLAGLAFGLVSILFAERFQDVSVAASGHVNFFKPPEQYSVEESRLLSGRPRIWSMYIYGWLRGDVLNHLIGFGPESWSKTFPLYAHNTLINYLYEYGLLGVIAVLFLWLSMLTAALRVRHPHRGTLLGAHFSFLLLNMSTMPMWMIEGNILYGIICGYTLYLLSLRNQAATRVPHHPSPPGHRMAA